MADRPVGKRSMDQRGFSKVESGTCNVCAAPCSSCMHRDVGFTGAKSGESSDENCHGVAGSQCSVTEDGTLPSSVNNVRNSSNNTASEASNLVSSNHDALSENAESKEIIRCSGVSDGSRAVSMTSKTYVSKSRMKRKESASANVLNQRSNCVEGQEDRILSDDPSKNLNSGYLNNKIVNEDSALVSDVIRSGSGKDQDSTMAESSCVLPNEVKSQSLHISSSNHEDNTSSERGIFKDKLGKGGNKEIEEPSSKGSTISGQNGKDGKSSKSTSANQSDEPISSPMSESESDDSEMVEHDVKVCDICGDAGREDLLAICSGCSDGAEHTYCMRVRLNEVPEGDWLCEECEEAEKQKQVAKKGETTIALDTNNSGKRHADKTEAAPDAKRQAVDGSTRSPKKSVLPKIGALSRETSFKGLDRSRAKLNHQTSFSDNTESGRSTGSHLQPPKGAFLKSSSFNCSSSKPKVQLMDDIIPPRQKTGKEYTSLDIKEGDFKNVGKSMSSRTTDTGTSNGNDSQTKSYASKVYSSKEGKSSKQLNNRSTEVNVSASSTDQKPISRSNLSASYANNSRDLKGLQSDGKRGSLTKQVSNLNRNRLQKPVASGGDENCSGSEQSSSQADCKDELPSTCEVEAVPSHGIVASQDKLSRSREFREVGKKNKESFGKRQRSSLLSGAKGLPPSQKGGQTAQSSETSGVSDSDLTTTKNVREDINKDNKLRAAVDAALRKKPSFGKNKTLEQQPDVPLVSNVDSNTDKTSRYQLPSKMHKNYVLHEGLQGGHSTLWPASDPYKQTYITNEKQLVLPGAVAMRSVEPENYPSVWPVMRDWPLVSPPDLLRSSAIPDHESIWQGDLEVRKTRNHSAMHNGMQAHLSTLASPKVAEVVNKFPEKFSLNEVPRLSTWPAQFQDIGTKEDHIALFFFAKDFESYERNYKPLVDNMIKRDLALKGHLDNVELLIFPSNQLPPNCQRWNTLYFLWGVFRGRKGICSNPQKNTSLPASNVLPSGRDPSNMCQTSSPSKPLEKASSSSLRESSHNIIETQNSTDVLSHENPSDRGSSVDLSSNTKEETAIEEAGPAANHIPCQAAASNSGDSIAVQKIVEHESGGRNDLPLIVTGSEIQPHDQVYPAGRDLNCSQGTHRKRPLWDLARPTIETSSAMNQKVELNSDGLCEGSAYKKLKTVNESSSSFSCDTSSYRDSGLMKKSPKVVFPLDLNEETTEETIGLLPFLAGTSSFGEQNSNCMINEKQKEEEDADAAVAPSLCLSLSFPTEEPKNVDTPLFLFRDLPR